MYIKTSRGGDKFIADGYMYTYDKTSSDGKIKFWRCEFKSDKCRARLHTSVETNEVIKKLNEHRHKPDPQRVVASQMRSLLKRKAEIMASLPVIKAEMIEAPEEHCSSSFQQPVYIKEEPDYKVSRQENEDFSSTLSVFEQLGIPEGLKYHDLGKGKKVKFLLNDCSEALILAREDFRDWARFMKTVYIDTTFKKSPYTFSQICVIFVERDNYLFTVMYVFLQDSSEARYIQMAEEIRKVWPEFSPEVIQTNFSATLYSALTKEFPTATINGCYLLLKDVFNERISQLGLQNKYNKDYEFALQAKMILGIAFVPEEDVTKIVRVLRELLPEDLLEILNWFEKTFIGNEQSPLYPFKMWSVYNKIAKGNYHTNDGFEILNRLVHTELETGTVLVTQFIVAMQVVQRKTDATYDDFVKGKMAPLMNVQENLMYLIKTYSQRTLYEYIRGIAGNI